MWGIVSFILVSLGLGILFAIPGILFGFWLRKLDIAPNRYYLVIPFSVFFVFIKRIWFSELSIAWFALILITATTLGIYRMDLYWATRQGK
jgi:hypothetical protein